MSDPVAAVVTEHVLDWMESYRPVVANEIINLRDRGGVDGLRKSLRELERATVGTFPCEANALTLVKIEEIRKALPPEAADIFAGMTSFKDRQDTELPPRVWYVQDMICPGFNMLTAKKSMGKSFLLLQMANAVADGYALLGRETVKAKVLFVSFELDEADLHERFAQMGGGLSENAFLLHSWSAGERAIQDAERAFEMGFKVVIFDTFLPMLPVDRDWKLNEYADSDFYLKWRVLAKRYGAAVIASWHEGKTARDDFMLNAIGSTGMVGQADSVISIDRKRGDPAGKLFIAGNHAPDQGIPITFENGRFTLRDGEVDLAHLSPDEERTMLILQQAPGGCAVAAVALGLGRSEASARMTLNRLKARGKATNVNPNGKRGLWSAA